jgi:hypothetical protein
MSDENEKSRNIAAMQLVQWLLLHLVNNGTIRRDEAIQWLERAIELNIRGNDDHVKVAKIFENLLSGIRGPLKPKPDSP